MFCKRSFILALVLTSSLTAFADPPKYFGTREDVMEALRVGPNAIVCESGPDTAQARKNLNDQLRAIRELYSGYYMSITAISVAVNSATSEVILCTWVSRSKF